MIVGGMAASDLSKKAQKTYLKMVQNVQLTSFVPKIAWTDNPIIKFSEEMHDVYTTRMTMHS